MYVTFLCKQVNRFSVQSVYIEKTKNPCINCMGLDSDAAFHLGVKSSAYSTSYTRQKILS